MADIAVPEHRSADVPARGRQVREETRAVALEGVSVEYVLRRSSRRSVALMVDHRGLRVAAPWTMAEREIEGFIQRHSEWLRDKLASRAQEVGPAPFVMQDGVSLVVFGETCRIRLDESLVRTRWRVGRDGVEELVVRADAGAAASIIRALHRRALPWFSERVAEYCFKLGRPAPPVRLSNARTRWGSCSARSGIRLHWRLVHLPPALIDYVVAHEVAHLIEMNHSPRFWALVAQLYPNWRAARAQLREAGRLLPVIEGAPGAEISSLMNESEA